ncbi:hypothetical protein [Streptomyces sp. NPDC002403]
MLKEHSHEEPVAQSIGVWSSQAYRLTATGEAGRLRARERKLRVRHRTHEGIPGADFVTTVNVLRRVVANPGGDGELPD